MTWGCSIKRLNLLTINAAVNGEMAKKKKNKSALAFFLLSAGFCCHQKKRGEKSQYWFDGLGPGQKKHPLLLQTRHSDADKRARQRVRGHFSGGLTGIIVH